MNKFYRPILLVLALQIGAMQAAIPEPVEAFYDYLIHCFTQQASAPAGDVAGALGACLDFDQLPLEVTASVFAPGIRIDLFLLKVMVVASFTFVCCMPPCAFVLLGGYAYKKEEREKKRNAAAPTELVARCVD